VGRKRQAGRHLPRSLSESSINDGKPLAIPVEVGTSGVVTRGDKLTGRRTRWAHTLASHREDHPEPHFATVHVFKGFRHPR
jgi:hypothetical protein